MSAKKWIALMLCVCVMIGINPRVVQAAEPSIEILALGDSISAGFGLPDYDEADLSKAKDGYVNKLAAATGVKTVNLSVEATITSRMLTQLEDPAYQKQIMDSERILLSIGGNNVLEPITTALKVEFGLTADATPEQLEAKFQEYGLIGSLSKAKNAVAAAQLGIQAGVTAFKIDYPVIIQKIRALAPDAQLYVSTVYHPYKDVTLAGIDLDGAVRDALTQISDVIRAAAVDDQGSQVYTVVDVAQAFERDGTGERLTNVNVLFSGFNLDPHPSKAGNELIYKLYGRVLFQELAPKTVLTDISVDPARDAIAYLAALGIIGGVGNNLYDPSGPVTRAQFVKILYGCVNAYNPEPKPAIAFRDVAEKAWYRNHVIWAYTAGVTNGTGSGVFSPDQRISHQDLCTMLFRYLKNSGYDIGDGVAPRYSDDGLIAAYASANVYGLKALGITFGDDADGFRPTADTTRAEAAVILSKFLKYISRMV